MSISRHEAVATNTHALRDALHKIERRDSRLWLSTVIVLILMGVATLVLSLPMFGHSDVMVADELQVGGRGLFGLVLLFSSFVLYQLLFIKRLRQRLADQIQLATALQTRADIF